MLDFADPEPLLPAIPTMTSEQKRMVMDHAGMLRSFIVAVEDSIKTEVDHGSQDYDGHYKLVRKTTRRKFTDDALDELCSPLFDHLDESDIFETKGRTMSEIQRRLKKKLGAKDAKEIMDDVTTKPEGELVIAPESDKRRAEEPSVIGDFTGL